VEEAAEEGVDNLGRKLKMRRVKRGTGWPQEERAAKSCEELQRKGCCAPSCSRPKSTYSLHKSTLNETVQRDYFQQSAALRQRQPEAIAATEQLASSVAQFPK
jgi:hypothetical protein